MTLCFVLGLCQAGYMHYIVDLSSHHEAGSVFSQMRPLKHRKSRIFPKFMTQKMGTQEGDLTSLMCSLELHISSRGKEERMPLRSRRWLKQTTLIFNSLGAREVTIDNNQPFC